MRVYPLIVVLAVLGYTLTDDYPPIQLAIKPLPVWALALLVAQGTSPVRTPILTGLVLSGIGDVVIESNFLAGMVSFALAHIAYLIAFVHQERRLAPVAALPFAAWGIGLLSTLGPSLGELALPVAGYGVLLCSMMWRAVILPGPTLTRVGAVLFGLSDSLIALRLADIDLPAHRALIMATYWAGQVGIATLGIIGAFPRMKTT